MGTEGSVERVRYIHGSWLESNDALLNSKKNWVGRLKNITSKKRVSPKILARSKNLQSLWKGTLRNNVYFMMFCCTGIFLTKPEQSSNKARAHRAHL